MKENIERLEWVDFLKGFLLICIFFSHFGYVPVPFKFLIVPTGDVWVPIFFFLSGLLYDDKRNLMCSNFLKKKFRSLLLPYLFFFLIFLLLDWNLYLKGKITFQLAKHLFLFAEGPPKASPLWFVARLFEINIFYFFILFFIKNFYCRLLVIFLCSFIGFSLFFYSIHLPLGIDTLFSTILFFGIGHLFKDLFFNALLKLNECSTTLNLATLFILITISYETSYLNNGAVLGMNKINNYFLFYSSAFAGCFSAIIFSFLLLNNFTKYILLKSVIKIFKYTALHALPILASHCFIIIIVDFFLKHYDLTFSVFGFFLKLFILIPFIYFIIVPFSYNKLYFIVGSKKANWSKFI